MSNTRRAKDETEFHQNRFASSPEFERGLSAKLVARRVAVLNRKADRELIWFLQYLSHQDGGLAAVASQLIEKYPDRMGTPAMLRFGKSGKQNYSADEVRKIRTELPANLRSDFALKGESEDEILAGGAVLKSRDANPGKALLESINAEQFVLRAQRIAKQARYAQRIAGIEDGADASEARRENDDGRHTANFYPVCDFTKKCLEAALKPDGKMTALEKLLYELCLDPAVSLDATGPWYFAGLVDALRDFSKVWTAQKAAVTVITSFGDIIYDALNYTAHSRKLSLTQGGARTGKSFAAKAWCLKTPGRARLVEVPSGNDEGGFFRAIARGLGLGSLAQYKACDIRERVESVLLNGDLVLVLDEAQRLWPQRNLRYGYPSRIEWIMTMTNAGVPIGMISTPQFLNSQKAMEKNGWNSAQLAGRLGRRKELPAQLPEKDLIAVTKSLLPEADEKSIKAIVYSAIDYGRWLGAVESTSTLAKYIAMLAGREQATANDVRQALRDSVIEGDKKPSAQVEKNDTQHPSEIIVEAGATDGVRRSHRQTFQPGEIEPLRQPEHAEANS
jgi:hypothetical protein